MTRAGHTKEIPWEEAAPIITASITGGLIFFSDFQRTMKQGSPPPLTSDSPTMKYVDSKGPNKTGFSR